MNRRGETIDWFVLIGIGAFVVFLYMIILTGCGSKKGIVVEGMPEEISCEEALRGAWDQMNGCWKEQEEILRSKANYLDALSQCRYRLQECLDAGKDK